MEMETNNETNLEANETENNLENENASDENASENSDAENKENSEQENSENKSQDQAGVPEEYDYSAVKMPENMTLDKDMLGEFNALAKDQKMTQEQANKCIDLAVRLVEKQSKGIAAQYQQIQQAKIASYQQALNTDKEIAGAGKANMDEYIDTAQVGYEKFVNQDLQNVFRETGLNYHPEVVKLFHKLGKLCEEDKLPNVSTPAGKEKSAAEILYGSKE